MSIWRWWWLCDCRQHQSGGPHRWSYHSFIIPQRPGHHTSMNRCHWVLIMARLRCYTITDLQEVSLSFWIGLIGTLLSYNIQVHAPTIHLQCDSYWVDCYGALARKRLSWPLRILALQRCCLWELWALSSSQHSLNLSYSSGTQHQTYSPFLSVSCGWMFQKVNQHLRKYLEARKVTAPWGDVFNLIFSDLSRRLAKFYWTGSERCNKNWSTWMLDSTSKESNVWST